MIRETLLLGLFGLELVRVVNLRAHQVLEPLKHLLRLVTLLWVYPCIRVTIAFHQFLVLSVRIDFSILFEQTLDIVFKFRSFLVVLILPSIGVCLEVVGIGIDLVLKEVQTLIHDVYHGVRLGVMVKGICYWGYYGRWETPAETASGDEGTAVLVQLIGAHLEVEMLW